MKTWDNEYDKYYDNYLEWLMDFASGEGGSDSLSACDKRTLLELWSINWEGRSKNIGNDLDRERDGYALRTRYAGIIYGFDVPIGIEDIYGPVRVLEVLIAISMHMYDIMMDTNVYNSVGRWVWEMIGNAGLDGLQGEELEKKVTDILQRKDGFGWFSLPDCAGLEVWYQMHEYLLRYF